MIRRESFKLDKRLLDAIRKLKKQDAHTIVWHLERALRNYLKQKKIVWEE